MHLDVFDEAEQLSRVPLFSKLSKAKLKLLAFTSERITLADKEFLFRKGDLSDSAYLILDGVLNVVIEHATGGHEVVFEQHKNELTGEMGVIRNLPRAGSIRASGVVTVLKIEADSFMALLSENPSMSLHVMRMMSDKLDAALAREAGH